MAFTGTYKACLGKMIYSTPPVVWNIPEAASQTFLEGDLVYRTGGYLTVCGADPALILGIAKEDGHDDAADGSHNVDVLVLTGAELILMHVYSATPGTSVLAQTQEAVLYEIAASSSIWYVDLDNTGSTRVRVQKFYDPIGTLDGRVYVSFIPANREVS